MLTINGSYLYYFNTKTGTKWRLGFRDKPKWFESIDLKITNYCTHNCEFCYENSTPGGKHADMDTILNILDKLHPGCEVCLGGGNPITHPNFEEILYECKKRKLIANTTINMYDFFGLRQERIREWFDSYLIHGLGLSWNGDFLPNYQAYAHPRIVIHVIIGYHTVYELNLLMQNFKEINFKPTILMLGYKSKGRGKNYEPEIHRFARDLFHYVQEWNCNISFDTLAVKQLGLKTDTIYYLGDEGEHSCYIDAVEKSISLASYYDEKKELIDDLSVPTVRSLFNV